MLLDIHSATVRSYLHRFNDGGFDGLKAGSRTGRPAKLKWSQEQWADLLAQAPSDFDKLTQGLKIGLNLC